MLQPFINKTTAQKIKFVQGKEQKVKALRELGINPEDMPERLGGAKKDGDFPCPGFP